MLESTDYATIKLLSYVKSMYNIPRYGHSRDITVFFSDDNTLRKDYMLGLILVFTIIMTIAAVWIISLLILRILGHRVGCASGGPATIPAESMSVNQKGSVNTDETGEFIVMQADQNRVNRTRIVFFASVLYSLAACGVLLYSFFMAQGAFQDFYESAEELKDGFALIPVNLQPAIDTSTAFETPKNEMITDLADFCDGATVTVGGSDPSQLTENFRASLEALTDLALDGSWSTFNASLPDMNEALGDMVSFIGFLESRKEIWFICLICATGVAALLTLYLFACAWRSGKEGYEFVGEAESTFNTKFLNCFAVPMFALLMAGTWFSASVAFTSGAANADFCYNEISTGDAFLQMLRYRGFDESSTFYKLTDDYLHGCVDGNSALMPSADAYNTALTNAQSSAAVFTALDVDALDAACTGNATATMTKADDLSAELSALVIDYNKVYGHMSCDSIAPLAQKAVYENSCNSMSKGILWTFASALSFAVFGTILLSLRSATQRPQIYLVPANTANKSDDVEDDESYIVDSDDSRY
jgi:hypothetical protein